MSERPPVAEISGHFADAPTARAAAAALNGWFRWIVEGSHAPVPDFFAAFGVDAADYGWALEEDVDWRFGPHARALAEEVRISIQTHDTQHQVAGLLRRMGATRTRIVRDDE